MVTLVKEENPIIKNVDIIGISLIHSSKISETFSLNGEHYSGSKVFKKLVELIKIYREEGFSLAEVQSVEFNEEENRLKIFVDEGIISRIDVVGNLKTNNNVITREFNFKEGDLF